jgi:hypothetical protein
MTQPGPDITSATVRKRTIDEELAVPPLPSAFARLQQLGLVVGVGCLIVCLIGAFVPALGGWQVFFRAYLVGYLFWLGIAVGSLAWVMVHHLTGGDWGLALFRPAEAASRTLPLMAFLFIPIIVGHRYLFPWAHVGDAGWMLQHVPDAEQRHALAHQVEKWYGVSAYVIRAVICFAVWCALAFWLSRVSIILDRTDDLHLARRIRKVSSFGIVMFIISATLMSFDLVQAREAGWFSSINPFIMAVSWAMSALVFLIAIQRLLVRYRPFGEEVTPNVLNDLGNLFLTCTILWAYMSFSQLLIIWMGNVRSDTPWYVRRGLGQFANGWSWVALLLISFHFFVPFILLLMRWTKRHLDRLTALATLAMVMRLIDTMWHIVPSSMDGPAQYGRFRLSLVVDILMAFGLGGVWVFTYVWVLGSRPLLSHLHPDPQDSEMETPAEHAAHGRAVRPAHGH